MHIYIYMIYTHIYIHIYTNIFIYKYSHIYIYIYAYIYIHICIFVYTYICIFVYIYIYMYILIVVFVYRFIFVYIYMYSWWYLHLYIEQRDLTCFDHQTMGYEGEMILGCWLGCKHVNCLTHDVSLGSCLPFRYHFFVNSIPRMFLNSFPFYPYVWYVMLSFSPFSMALGHEGPDTLESILILSS